LAPALHSIFFHDGGRAGHYLQKVFQRAYEQIASVNAIARAKADDLSSRRYVLAPQVEILSRELAEVKARSATAEPLSALPKTTPPAP
jgi:hypothetical protein